MVNLSEIIGKFINAGIIGDNILDGTYKSPFIHLYKSGDIEAIHKTILFETVLIHSLGGPACKLRVSIRQLFDLKKDKAEDDMARYMESKHFKVLVAAGLFEADGTAGFVLGYPEGTLSEDDLAEYLASIDMLNFVLLHQFGEGVVDPVLLKKAVSDTVQDDTPDVSVPLAGVKPVVKTLMEEFGNPSQPPLQFTRESARISEEMDRKATHLLPRHARLC